MAELSDLRCKLKDSNYLHQFKIYARDLFENFQARQKQQLISKIL
jgi:hypothetical protein